MDSAKHDANVDSERLGFIKIQRSELEWEHDTHLSAH